MLCLLNNKFYLQVTFWFVDKEEVIYLPNLSTTSRMQCNGNLLAEYSWFEFRVSLVQSETQTSLFWIWNLVEESFFSNDNHYV